MIILVLSLILILGWVIENEEPCLVKKGVKLGPTGLDPLKIGKTLLSPIKKYEGVGAGVQCLQSKLRESTNNFLIFDFFTLILKNIFEEDKELCLIILGRSYST